MEGTTGPSCAKCSKSPPEVSLKSCAKWRVSQYCSRDCQNADWKVHKQTCGKPGPGEGVPTSSEKTALSLRKGVDRGVPSPFTRLQTNTFLHDRSEKDVFRLLIDSHRLGIDDDKNFSGMVHKGSIYDWKTSDSLGSFRNFLDKAEETGVLPGWWSKEKREECENFGMGGGEFSDLRSRTDKTKINERYGHTMFPMQLRVLAEGVYGSPVVQGQFGAGIIAHLAQAEQGDSRMAVSQFSLA